MEQHRQGADEGSKRVEVREWAKKSRGELERATAWGISILEASGMALEKAGLRMLAPEMSAMVETSAERVAQAIYGCMDYEMSLRFNEDLSVLDGIASDSVGHMSVWAFDDGSAWVSFAGHEREVAHNAVAASAFEKRETLCDALWRMWSPADAPLSVQVGKKFLEAKIQDAPLVALTGLEASAFVKGVASAWRAEGVRWGKGMVVKLMSNGQELAPADFEKMLGKSLGSGKADLTRMGMRKVEEMKRERETRMKVHWRDAICLFIAQPQAMPVYDAGMAAFLMSKPGLFGQFPMPVWRKMFFEIVDYIKPLAESDSLDLSIIESSASILGGDVASQLAHFMYRYHRSGGAKMTARRVLEQTRERMALDAGKQGLAAVVRSKERDPISEEMRESSKAASSVEFSTQYGASLALYASIWAKETGFADISLQARAVVKTMRGAGEISMECFGWFARLMFEFGEGSVSREDIARTLQREMEAAAKLAEEEKRRGGKITIENEWSGNWGSELAGRKVREYLNLGLERSKPITG